MFQTTMCPLSGETTVFMRHLVLVILYGIPLCIPGSHPYRITSTKCRINTVVSPDDGHIVAQNVYRLINIPRNKPTKKKLCTKLALFTSVCVPM